MFLTQQQIDVLKQNLRRKRIRIELLDFDMRAIDFLEGVAIAGSITADANNDIRRSGNITLAIPTGDGSTLLDKLDGYSIELGGKIWLDKYIKIFIGIDDSNSGDTVWYNMGVFLINKPERNFSATDFTISFECIDLMAKLTGQRQGQLTGQAVSILKGEEIVDSEGKKQYVKTSLEETIVSVITDLGGFTKYSIYPIPVQYKYLPYDIKVGIGATVYDILKELTKIISTWQMYFDTNGTFIFEPIPSGDNAIVYDVDFTHYIAETHSADFENVKNQVVVYGRTNILSYFTENTENELTNVEYVPNMDNKTSTLVLKYSSVNTETLTVSGVTFGFLSLPKTNDLPITNVEIWSAGEKIISTNASREVLLVKFENSISSFGENYSTTQVEVGAIPEDEVCFIRIFSANLNDNEYVDTTKDITFEFMGKQVVSYSLINYNRESPFYINNGLGDNSYYALKVKTPTDSNRGEGYDLFIDNETRVDNFTGGEIITFVANAPNIHKNGSPFTYINVYSNGGNKILNNVPMVDNRWLNDNNGIAYRPYLEVGRIINDYTVWQLKYEVYEGAGQFVFMGRCKTALIKVFNGGEYDNISADQLAYERCVWELYKHSNLNDNVTISIVPNYVIDVNKKIPYDINFPIIKNSYSYEQYVTMGSPSGYMEFITSTGEVFYVRKSDYNGLSYLLTKNITYPLEVGTTAQVITAIQIYDSGNLLGEDY